MHGQSEGADGKLLEVGGQVPLIVQVFIATLYNAMTVHTLYMSSTVYVCLALHYAIRLVTIETGRSAAAWPGALQWLCCRIHHPALRWQGDLRG